MDRFAPIIAKLADNISSRYPVISFEEAQSAGVMGLLDALERYNSGKSSLSTFAWWRIRGSILDEIRSTSQGGIVGAGKRELSITDKVDGVKSRINGEMQRQVDAKEDIPQLIKQARRPLDRKLLTAWYVEGQNFRSIADTYPELDLSHMSDE